MEPNDSVEVIETEVFIPQTKIPCPKCPYRSPFRFALDAHWKNNHVEGLATIPCCTSNLERYKCKQCRYSTNFRTNLWRHTKLAHTKKKVKEDKPIFLFLKDTLDGNPSSISPERLKNVQIFKTSHIYYLGDHNYCKNHAKHILQSNSDHSHTIPLRKHLQYAVVKRYNCHRCDHITNLSGPMETHLLTKHSFDDLVMWLNCEEYNEIYTKYTSKFHLCPHCSFRAKQLCNLKSHVRSMHSTLLLCRRCPFQTIHRREFREHRRFVCFPSSSEFYKCELCPYEALRKGSIDHHMNLVHIKEIPRKENALESHFIPSKRTVHLCMYCSFQTRQLKVLENHKSKFHQRSLKTGPVVSVQDLQDHPKRLPPFRYKRKTRVQKCPYHRCTYETTGSDTLLDHCFRNHIVKRHVTAKDKSRSYYRCSYCPYIRNTAAPVRRHEAERHLDMKLAFTVSQVTTSTGTKYACTACEYSSETAWSLKRHIYMKHTPDTKIHWFKCDLCKFRAKEKYKLTMHRKKLH